MINQDCGQVSLVEAQASDSLIISRHRNFHPDAGTAAINAYEQWVANSILERTYFGWLAVCGGVIVGGAGLVLLNWGPTRDDLQAQRGRIVNVFVEEPNRRRGIARALTLRVVATAKDLGLGTLTLSTSDSARQLYESLSFKPSNAEMSLKLAPGIARI